jgi:hypothetical protein
MTNATILQVHGSPEHFPVLETDQGFFEMRYGGVLRLKGMPNGAYVPMDVPFLGQVVEAALTDDHWVHLITRSGAVISHGPGWISGDGHSEQTFLFRAGAEALALLKEFEEDPELRLIVLR